MKERMTNQRDTIYKLFNMQPGEGKTVLLFIVYSLFMGMSVAIFYTCTTSLFLTTFNQSELPFAFIAGGLLIYTLGILVRRVQHRLSFVQTNNVLLFFLFVSVASLLIAPEWLASKWVYFTLFLWNRVFVFVNGITFWSTASHIFNLQQAKRLFSFINMGDVISSVLSYFSVPVLLSFVSTKQLLLLALLALAVCVGLMLVINRRFRVQLSVKNSRQDVVNEPVSTEGRAVHIRYYKQLYLLALLSVFGLVYVEFMFTVQLKQVFPNKEILASFLGIFFGMCSTVEAFIKAFLYNRLMNTYSIRIGILMLPLALLFSYTLSSAYSALFGPTALLLAFIALSRFFMSTVRRSVSEPAFQLLFQPIPMAERTRLQSRIEGVPKALGNVLAGAMLLLLHAVGFSNMGDLSYVFLVIVVCWVGISFQVQAEYQLILKRVVSRSSAYVRQLVAVNTPTPPHAVRVGSALSFEKLVALTNSPRPDDRQRAAEDLGHSSRYYAYTHLLRLLRDNHPAVRKAALAAAGTLGKRELWPRLFEHLSIDEYAPIATEALICIGDPVVPALAHFFNRNAQSTLLEIRVVSIINEIGNDASLRFLRNHINYPVQIVRDKVFEGLRRLEYKATTMERPHLLAQLDDQLSLLVWLAATRLDMTGYGGYDRQSTLVRALRQEKQLVVPKVFNLLSILCGDDRFDLISELIGQKNDEIKGYLIELLSSALPAELKERVLPLFADVPLDEKLRQSSVYYPQQRLSVEDRLRAIINKDFDKLTPALKAVAIHELLIWHETDPTAILVANGSSCDELIAETALYVLKVLNPDRFTELHKALRMHLEPEQYRVVSYVAGDFQEGDLLVRQEHLIINC